MYVEVDIFFTVKCQTWYYEWNSLKFAHAVQKRKSEIENEEETAHIKWQRTQAKWGAGKQTNTINQPILKYNMPQMLHSNDETFEAEKRKFKILIMVSIKN